MAENAAPVDEPRRTKVAMPYIMPDGRPLALFLASDNAPLRGGHRGHNKKKSRRLKEPSQGWSSSNSANVASAGPPPPPRALSEAELVELTALDKVGQRRQRRYLNDKLLRDMAGATTMTAKDIESLFKPAPFGDTGHESAWAIAARPEHAALWELFRSVDVDKQARVLQKWEAHVEELRREAASSSNVLGMSSEEAAQVAEREASMRAAAAALEGWAAVGPRGRKALRRAPYARVEMLERQILGLLDSPEPSNELVIDDLEDGFERLIVHSLAAFHHLQTRSRDAPGQGRHVVVRRRYKLDPTANTSSTCQEEEAQQGGGVSGSVGRILATDVLWLLEEGGENMNLSARTLHNILLCPEVPSPQVGPVAVAVA